MRAAVVMLPGKSDFSALESKRLGQAIANVVIDMRLCPEGSEPTLLFLSEKDMATKMTEVTPIFDDHHSLLMKAINDLKNLFRKQSVEIEIEKTVEKDSTTSETYSSTILMNLVIREFEKHGDLRNRENLKKFIINLIANDSSTKILSSLLAFLYASHHEEIKYVEYLNNRFIRTYISGVGGSVAMWDKISQSSILSAAKAVYATLITGNEETRKNLAELMESCYCAIIHK